MVSSRYRPGRLELLPINSYWYRALRLRHWETRLSTEHSTTQRTRFVSAGPTRPGFRTLYLGETHQLVMFEVGALLGDPRGPVSDPRGSWVILNLHVTLDHVADLGDSAQQKFLGTNHQELTGDWENYSGIPPTQMIGSWLYNEPRVEGFLFEWV